jgi:hypothetical protein
MSDTIHCLYKDCDIIPGYMSDHSCTTLTLEIPEHDRGKGFWKFNSTLAKDPLLREQLRETINCTITDNPETDDCLLWDLIKCKMRGTCIGFASKKNKEKKIVWQKLEKNIQLLEETIQRKLNTEDSQIEDLEKELYDLKNEMDKLVTEKVEGEILRSKITWHEEGHKASKMFLNLEKSRGEAKTIRKLRTEGNITITNREDILAEEERYYKTLYQSKKDKLNHHLRKIEKEIWQVEGTTIQEETHADLVCPIKDEELWKAIKESPQNKSPGTDGLTNEFYKEYWPLIKDHLLKSLNTSLERGSLNISQKRGIISLIPKPQKDLEQLKNWRPITLLNQDYKYLTKILATRLEKSLPDIISNDQSGFVKCRYIGCNIQRLQNMIQMCKDTQIKGYLINIDFEKAFDTIEWDFIEKSLEKLGFPKKFTNWVRTLYNDIETCVMNNGYTTKFFQPERGVRQGCPISPYLFIITTEIMNRWLKTKMEHMGIENKQGCNYFIAQFADDTSFAIKEGQKPIHTLFRLLDEYGIISGLKLNIAKTEILLLGNQQKNDVPQRYKRYVLQQVNYLGCKISEDYKETSNTNIDLARTKFINLINIWKHRKTNLSGKIAIIKSILIPQFTYILSTMASPKKESIQEINRMLFKFIYDGGSEKIKRNVLIGEYEDGGFKMTDLESYIKSIKMTWVERLINIDGIWKEEIINKIGIEPPLFLRSNTKYKDLPFKFPYESLWDEIIETWCEENYYEPKTMDEVYNQLLWYNSHIKVGKKVIHWKHWQENNINWLADILMEDEHGLRFLTFEELNDGDGRIKIMEYNSLKSSIPHSWKCMIREYNISNQEETEDHKLIDQLLDQKKPMRYVYQKLVKRKKSLPTTSIEKWNIELNSNLTVEETLNGHKNSHWCSVDSKLRSFSCNFLNRNVPYNKRLEKMGKKDYSHCDRCKGEETLLHLYWECPESKKLWENLSKLYSGITKRTFDLAKEKCLLGTGVTLPKRRTESQIQRLLCLLTKYFIHINKCNDETEFNVIKWEMYIKHYLNLEKTRATWKGAYNEFHSIWSEWIPWVQS